MAIDTAAKRSSALNFGDGTTLHLLPFPDGTIDGGDKQHLLDCYSGIAFDTGGGGLPIPIAAYHYEYHLRK